jgi:adenylylsulfate kinase
MAEEMEERHGFAIWITGLPASGKSLITAALVKQLKAGGVKAVVLESDVLRKSFSTQPRYDEQDREYFYGSLALIGKVLSENGLNVIVDATANRRSYRERARALIPGLLEIYVDTPLEVCMARDPKGIYAGDTRHVPGLGAAYEPPLNPDLVIHGDRESPDDAARRIVGLLHPGGVFFRLKCEVRDEG